MKLNKGSINRFIFWITLFSGIAGPPVALFLCLASKNFDINSAYIICFIYWGVHMTLLCKLFDKGVHALRSPKDFHYLPER